MTAASPGFFACGFTMPVCVCYVSAAIMDAAGSFGLLTSDKPIPWCTHNKHSLSCF